MVELLVVVQAVGGSSPLAHPRSHRGFRRFGRTAETREASMGHQFLSRTARARCLGRALREEATWLNRDRAGPTGPARCSSAPTAPDASRGTASGALLGTRQLRPPLVLGPRSGHPWHAPARAELLLGKGAVIAHRFHGSLASEMDDGAPGRRLLQAAPARRPIRPPSGDLLAGGTQCQRRGRRLPHHASARGPRGALHLENDGGRIGLPLALGADHDADEPII